MKNLIMKEMEKKTIFFESNYISDNNQLDKLPYGYIDKTVCGCGATYLAITDKRNTIIAVPNVALVKNKVEQHSNLFGVYGGIKEEDIRKYVIIQNTNKDFIKIITTYDSLYKVVDLLDRCDLVIDESQEILTQSNLKLSDKKDILKKDVCNYLLDVAYKYKDKVTFVSATPIPLIYMPKWISEIPQYKFYFTNTIKVTPITIENQYPYRILKKEIILPLRDNAYMTLGGKTFKKAIIFINSVTKIKEIIKECGLKDVGYICSDTLGNDVKLMGYNRITDVHKLPKFTFITSSGFKGIDLYDKDSINIVVSNTSKEYQMLNLLTDLKQAVSRNRDKENNNKDTFIYIYNQNNFKKSDKELLQIINDTEKRILDNCKTLNYYKQTDKEIYESDLHTFSESIVFMKYSMFDNEVWDINRNAFNADKYFILETRQQYNKGFDIIGKMKVKPIILKFNNKTDKFSYLSIYKKYESKLNGEKVTFDKDELNCESYNLIDTYYKQNGTITGNSTYCKNMLKADNNIKVKIIIDVKDKLPLKRYKKSDLKKIVNDIYLKYGIKRKFNITDLNEMGINYKECIIKGYRYIDILNYVQ